MATSHPWGGLLSLIDPVILIVSFLHVHLVFITCIQGISSNKNVIFTRYLLSLESALNAILISHLE